MWFAMELVAQNKRRYNALVKKASPDSRVWFNSLRAFLSGGLLCVLGQLITNMLSSSGMGLALDDARMLTSVILIAAAVLLTGFGWYDTIAEYACAGTVVPITGFANAIAAPAIEFRSEGLVLGVGAKMFVIAGPVIVYGTMASVLVGLVYFLFK